MLPDPVFRGALRRPLLRSRPGRSPSRAAGNSLRHGRSRSLACRRTRQLRAPARGRHIRTWARGTRQVLHGVPRERHSDGQARAACSRASREANPGPMSRAARGPARSRLALMASAESFSRPRVFFGARAVAASVNAEREFRTTRRDLPDACVPMRLESLRRVQKISVALQCPRAGRALRAPTRARARVLERLVLPIG